MNIPLGDFSLSENKTSDQKFRFSLPKENLGIPGMHEILVTAAFHMEKEGGADHKINDRTLRGFHCTATFSKKVFWSDGVDGTVNIEDAGSFITVEPDVLHANIFTPLGHIKFEKNSKNELCLVRQEIQAKSVNNARHIFLENLTPFVDFLSFKANVPILIEKVLVTDTLHPISAFDSVTPFSPISISPHLSDLNPEMFPIFALFREAKTNGSPYYKFLCHFKIFEAIYSKLRPELFRKAKAESIELTKKKEVVPDHPELRNWLPEFIGKPIPTLVQTELTKNYRNEIAHFLMDNGKFLNVSENSIRGKYDRIVMLTEICVIEVITNQNNLFSEFVLKKNAPP